MIKIMFERENRYVEVAPGETLLNAARKAGVELHRHVAKDHACYGAAGCITCGVRITAGAGSLSPRTALEDAVPGAMRLACQARAFNDTVVSTIEQPRFMADTAAPTWGVFSSTSAGITRNRVRGVAQA